MAEMIPVTVLTGFLGAGKTTVLNRLLRRPELAGTAVLVNEFGEIGLDHLLVEKLDEDTVLLNAGCLCCTVRGDLARALVDLRPRVEAGEVHRVMIETTGLADPAPIIHTMMGDPAIAVRYRLDGIVTVVDAVHAMGQLDEHEEAVRQVAVADRIVLAKTDLADPEALVARLRRLNPGAALLTADHGEIDPASILNLGLFDASGRDRRRERRGWMPRRLTITTTIITMMLTGTTGSGTIRRIQAFCLDVYGAVALAGHRHLPGNADRHARGKRCCG